MDAINKIRQPGWPGNEELIYSILCAGIAVSLIFWPLLNSILCIVLLGYWLLFSKKKFSLCYPASRWMILFSLLFLVLVIGESYTSDIKEGLFQLQRKSAFILFPLIFGSSAVVTPVVFKRTLQTFAWSTFIGCLLGLINGIYIFLKSGATDQLFGYKLIVLKNMTPFMLGLYGLFSVLYLINKLYDAKSNRSALKKTDIIVAIFLFFFLFLLGNRTLLIGTSAFFLFYCYKLISKTLNRLLLISLFGVFFVLAVLFNPYFNRQWNDMTDFSKENNIQLDNGETLGRPWGGKTLRLSIWNCSWDIIENHWLVGVGTGDVQTALQEAYENRKFYFASRYNTYNAHNQYIQVTIAHGAIGLLIFLSCIFIPLSVSLKKKENRLYSLFLVCLALMCITESMLELNKGIIWYSFFNSIFMFRKT